MISTNVGHGDLGRNHKKESLGRFSHPAGGGCSIGLIATDDPSTRLPSYVPGEVGSRLAAPSAFPARCRPSHRTKRHGRNGVTRLVPGQLSPVRDWRAELRPFWERAISIGFKKKLTRGKTEPEVGPRTIRKEILLPTDARSRSGGDYEQYHASRGMFPNDLEAACSAIRFTFSVTGNPKIKFDGLTCDVKCWNCRTPSKTRIHLVSRREPSKLHK